MPSSLLLNWIMMVFFNLLKTNLRNMSLSMNPLDLLPRHLIFKLCYPTMNICSQDLVDNI